MTSHRNDRIWMQRALSLAEKGRGYVSPNPLVGCVIVSAEENVIGEGYHERYGTPHAEVIALNSVADRKQLNGATIYVTLEPCSHHGKTPPCADLICDYPFARAVVAMKDPTEKVNGQGIRKMRDCGIEVETGLLHEEAEELNEYWLHAQALKRPFVTLKAAQTADGYIAAPNGESQWISSQESRTLVHKWRSTHDAVMVGRNTAMHDNPTLTVRLVEGRNPKRIVVDGPLSLPKKLNLLSDQFEERTIVITYNKEKAEEVADPMLKLLQPDYYRGEMILVDAKDGHSNLKQALRKLYAHGITSVLVEGGQYLSTSLLREGLVDRLQLFIAPKLLGGGTKSVMGLGINRMQEIVPFKSFDWERVGPDMLLTANL